MLAMTSAGPVPKPPPGRGWYVLAGLIFIAAVAGSSLYVISQVMTLGGKLTQVVVPGRADLDLREAGTYTIFHEFRSVVDGKIYASNSLYGLRIGVQSSSGEPVTLRSPMATSRYSFSGRTGISVFEFDVRQPGRYRLTASYDDNRPEPQTVVTVAVGFVGGIITIVMVALAIAFSGVGIAVAIVVIVYLKRRRARQAPA